MNKKGQISASMFMMIVMAIVGMLLIVLAYQLTAKGSALGLEAIRIFG
ncbi:MAG: hypothetical protein ABIG20_02105 [archaeon]